MGRIISLKCDNCGYYTVFHLGQGLRDCQLDSVLSEFGEVKRNAISSLLPDNVRKTSWDVDRLIAVNKDNGEITVSPCFYLIENGTKRLIASGADPEKYDLIVESDLTDCKRTCICPKCGKELNAGFCGYWD